MANCSSCGVKIGFLEGIDGKCPECFHEAENSENAKVQVTTTPNRASAPNAPKTGAATILAYLSALIIAICSVISCLVLLAGNNGFVGFMVLVSGLGVAIFFMIMAEISHNVASLVRLANAKKEEE